MISWYESINLFRTSTINWNETLASSIEMTAWCSGTFCPLCRAFTLCAASNCLAFTSETIFPSIEEKSLPDAGAADGNCDGNSETSPPGNGAMRGIMPEL